MQNMQIQPTKISSFPIYQNTSESRKKIGDGNPIHIIIKKSREKNITKKMINL